MVISFVRLLLITKVEKLRSSMVTPPLAQLNSERLKKAMGLLVYMATSILVMIASKLDSSLTECESALSAIKNIDKV